MDDDNLIVPDLTNVPEDDKAEPKNAETTHEATAEQVDEAVEKDVEKAVEK